MYQITLRTQPPFEALQGRRVRMALGPGRKGAPSRTARPSNESAGPLAAVQLSLSAKMGSFDAVFSPGGPEHAWRASDRAGQTQQRLAVLNLARHRSALGNFLCILFNFPGGPIKRYLWPGPKYVYMGQFSIAPWGPKPICTAPAPAMRHTSVHVKPAQTQT